VISARDADDIYEVPLLFKKEKLDEYILNKLKLDKRESQKHWEEFVRKLKSLKEQVDIAIVGKYIDVRDAYISIREALKIAGVYNSVRVNPIWIDSEKLEKGEEEIEADGILVPGGFGHRGVEGKIRAITYARENDIPFLGICLGFQLSVVEFARNVLGYEDANSTEFGETKHPVIDLLPEQRGVDKKGGTMRLGDIEVTIKRGTIAYSLYQRDKVVERHRHRYEVNPEYIPEFEEKGLVFSGYSDNGRRMEILELPDKRFFFATQFHPEFKAKPFSPSPPFMGFVRAALNYRREKNGC